MEDNAKMTLDAVVLGIKSFTEYAAQLAEFDKKTKEAVDQLGESHQDQNYLKFCDFFEPVWAKMDIFKQEVEEFKNYLDIEKKRLEDYFVAGNKSII